MRSERGFTLVEMLASTVIFGMLVTVVLAPLGQLFQNTKRSDQKLQATTQAQEIIEYIKGQWQSYPINIDPTTSKDLNAAKRTENLEKYDKTCYSSLPNVTGLTRTITVYALDRNAAVGSTLTLSTNCGTATASTNPPPMKRVSVTIQTASGSQTLLTLDIPRP